MSEPVLTIGATITARWSFERDRERGHAVKATESHNSATGTIEVINGDFLTLNCNGPKVTVRRECVSA